MGSRLLAVWLALLLVLGVALPVAAQPAYPNYLRYLATVEQASFTLIDRFFEPIDLGQFFNTGIAAAEEELARQGLQLKLRVPTYTGVPRYDWEQFATSYLGAAAAYADQIDQEALAHAVIGAMARSLNDCHTFFVPPSRSAEGRARAQGEVGGQGIGITVLFGEDGYPVVEDAFRGAPAHIAGVQIGDRILAVDGQDVRGFTLARFAPLLREPVGQTAQLTIQRANVAAPFVLGVVRGRYTAPVLDTRMLENGIGYLRVYGFSQRLEGQAIQQAYIDLAGQGATAVVIDLRNNPGGSGLAAQALLGALVGRDVYLFSNVGRDGSVVPMYSTESRWPTSPRVAILVNERSVSAAEVVAAVAQDLGAARLFGTRTKGCLASVDMQPLLDGSTLGVTTARVVTANGRSLNRIGVTPDVEVDRTAADLARGDDPQLARALDWLRGRE